jgi:hypothetical protein
MASWQKNSYQEYRPGNSLRAWKEFFPNAEIYGCDIDPSTMILGEDRITTFVLDQTTFKLEDLEKFPLFDIIIDDGLHRDDVNLRTFIILQNKLKSNGLYVVEDLRANSIFANFQRDSAEFVNFPEQNTPVDNFLWI